MTHSRKPYMLVAAAMLMLLALAPASAQKAAPQVRGTVIDKTTRASLTGVNVSVLGTRLGAATDAKGRYEIFNLAAGKYTARFSMVGYKEKLVSNIAVSVDATTTLDVALDETPIEVSEVIVTPMPEKYDATGITARLSRQTVVEAPGSAQDILWVIQTLPGISFAFARLDFALAAPQLF